MTAVAQEPGWTVVGARRPSSPDRSVTARRGGFWSRPAWREFVLLAAVYDLYTLTRRVTAGGAGEAAANARAALRAEHAVGLAPERWLNHAVSIRPLLAVPADYAHATLHYAVTLVVLVWL